MHYRDHLDLITENPERAIGVCSKAGPWKYLRAEAVVPARSILWKGASRLDIKRSREEFYRVRTV